MAHTAHKDEKMMEELSTSPDDLRALAIRTAELIRTSRHTVTFTGAGISTAAGIPDYRGPDGVWTCAAQGREGEATGRDKKRVAMTSAVPTYCHMALVTLQQKGLLHHVISQNVDGLHRKSGIPADAISELHGNSNAEECNLCGKRFFRDYSVHAARGNHFTGRKCVAEGCDGDLRDTIINFGEDLTNRVLRDGFANSERADLHICLGSSLTVSPACYMPQDTKKQGGNVVIVNLQRTPLDDIADVRVHAPVDEFLALVMKELDLDVPPFTLRRRITVWHDEAAATVKAAGVDVTDGNCPQTLFDGAKVVAAAAHSERAAAVDDQSCDPNVEPIAVTSASALGVNFEGPRMRLSFFGHYGEPALTLPIPCNGAQSFDVAWDLGRSGAAAWVIARAPITMPDFTKCARGPSRLDSEAKKPAPPKPTSGNDTTGWFAVHPVPECPHCELVGLQPDSVVDVNAPCADCGNVGENMICGTCAAVHCGRHVKQHMLAHHEATRHPIVCGFVDLSFWCYECDVYIKETNKHIKPLYTVLCAAKFAEDA